jgi:hypothetical protein
LPSEVEDLAAELVETLPLHSSREELLSYVRGVSTVVHAHERKAAQGAGE